MVRDAHLAEDVTQGAFLALAQHAGGLAGRPVLSGWLHRTAQNLAAKAVRSEVRRRAREQEAAAMNELLCTEPGSDWEQVGPHLDAALGELSDQDRDALMLRYFEHKSAREMAQTLGISDGAAQKRVGRAVERLRDFFAKRGVTVGAGGLVVVISANAVQAAPVGLAATISAAAALAGTTAATTVAATAAKTIAMTMMQKTLIGAVLVAAIGTGIYEAHQASGLRSQLGQLTQQQAPLADQVRQVQHERDEATNRLAGLLAENEQLQSNQTETELLKLRGEVGKLRQQADESTRLREESTRLRQENQQWQQPVSPMTELIREKQFYAQAWMRAFRSYANNHQGQLPDSFELAAPYWPPDVGQWPGQTPDQFEILYHGSLDALTNADPNLEVVVFREKNLWQNVNGRWGRLDVLANGRAQYGSVPNGTADSDFSSYEKEHLGPLKDQ